MQKQTDVAADFAKTGYEGDITQRGQDIQAQDANARLALAKQQMNMQMLNTILRGIGGFSSKPAPGMVY
jgi:hypothetical protein